MALRNFIPATVPHGTSHKRQVPRLASATKAAAVLAIAATSVLSSCGDNPAVLHQQEEEASIVWDVRSAEKHKGSRSLIINGIDDLKLACTPEDRSYLGRQGKGNAIGFWCDMYDHIEGRQYVDIFNSDRTKLAYFQKEFSPSPWNYEGNDLKWTRGGEYKIRAFYPQSLSTNIVRSATNADFFALEYNSHICQEDLMIAWNHVFTQDPVDGQPSIAIDENNEQSGIIRSGGKEGYSKDFTISSYVPVPLHFKHALAAVRLRFAFAYEQDDELQEVHFHNGTKGKFHTLGILAYGDLRGEEDSGEDLPPYQGVSENPAEGLNIGRATGFDWISYHTLLDDEDFYRWDVSPNGIPFGKSIDGTEETDVMAVAYSPAVRQIVRVSRNGTVTSETETADEDSPLPTVKQNRPFYNENDGWVFIIPQSAILGTKCHFRTKKMGEVIVDMPALTGTLKDGTLSPTGSHFAPGHRYTYTITLNKSNSDISLTISDWDERYVVQNIEFEI